MTLEDTFRATRKRAREIATQPAHKRELSKLEVAYARVSDENSTAKDGVGAKSTEEECGSCLGGANAPAKSEGIISGITRAHFPSAMQDDAGYAKSRRKLAARD